MLCSVLRHYKAEEAGERHKIPGPFWVILDMLEVKGVKPLDETLK